MTRWRALRREERLADFRHLASFLDPRIAAEIAAMPAVADIAVPFAFRADTWLYRTQALLRSTR